MRAVLPRWSRIAAALAAVVVLTGACTTTGADEGTRSSGQNGYVGTAQNLNRVPVAEREVVPTISGPALSGGKTLSTADFKGKVVVVNVWGSWCPPCRKEAPDLQAASVETKGRAQFIGVTSKDNDPAQAEAFVRAFGVTYPSIYDPDGKVLLNFARELPPSAIPSTMVLDSEGRLAVRILGPISKITLVNIIDDVANGR